MCLRSSTGFIGFFLAAEEPPDDDVSSLEDLDVEFPITILMLDERDDLLGLIIPLRYR